MAKVLTFGGMNTIADRTRLKDHELILARDVDLTHDRRAQVRKGYRKVQNLPVHSVWCSPGCLLVGSRNLLYRLDPADMSLHLLATLQGSGQISFDLVADGLIAFTNKTEFGFIDANSVSVIWPDPPPESMTVTLDSGVVSVVDSGLDPMPPGQLVAATSFGNLVVANGNLLIDSIVYRGEAVDRLKGYTPLDSYITMLKAVDGGLWVSTSTAVWFRAGAYDEAQWIKKAAYPAIDGTAVVSRGDLLGGDQPPVGKVVWWRSERGICFGDSAGNFHNVSQGKVAVPGGQSGTGIVREQDGQAHYVSIVRGSGTAYNSYQKQSADYDQQEI